MGQADEDSDLAIVNGITDDTSELVTDNEYSDEYISAPGTVDNASDVDDYDPEQIIIGHKFDLALIKKLNAASSGPIMPGDTVICDLTVYNQGTLDATNIKLADYIPTGAVLNDANWSGNGKSGPDTTTLTINSLAARDSITVTIVLLVDGTFKDTIITNNAEIIAATNSLGLVDEDGHLATIDGSADDTSELATDDEYSDEYINAPGSTDNPSDVDDYDLLPIAITQDFDLAVTKILSPFTLDPFLPGSTVIFDVTVYNQGTLDATNVQLTDYIPTGLTLSSADWSGSGTAGPGATSLTIDSLLAGDSTTVTIAFNVDTAYMGIAITNNVEITAATNALGLIDEDGNLLTVDGSANDTRELTTNDEYSDEYSNAPGTIDDISDVDDYDPEMITVVQEFDLALIKRLASAIPGSFMQNSIVTFDLTVFNQGTVHATNIILTDYIPSGLILDDSNWGANGTVGPATTSRKIGDIVAGDSTTVSIKFIVDSSFMGTIITNNAEITAATNASGLTDHDGALITIHGTSNDTSELATNNEYSDEYINAPGTADNTSDVDDYDLEQIVIDQEFDLALVEKLNASTPGPFMPGSTVKYDIILYNQGTLGASDIQITDYIPTGLVLNDANWSGNGKSGPDTTVRTIASLPAGDSTTITINFIVGNVFMGTIITNNTEITSAANSLGMVDEDGDLAIVNGSADDITELSTDNEYSDEYTNAPGIVDNALDADDYDPVQITVGQEFDLALTKKLNTLSPGPFIPDSTVMYDITVYNQGTMDATDITITDYIGTGLVLNDSNWSGNGTSGPDTTTRTIASLSARGSATVTIAFTIDSSFMDTLITNNAEITAANNALSLVDEDDDLANINGNADDTSELSTDDEYSDEYLNAPGTTDNASDYDDYDPAQITVNQTFDLALVKKLDSSTPGPFMQGSAVAYKITIYNQGTLDATKIEVTDYIPTGLMLSDSNWSGIGVIGPTTTVDTIAFLSAGDSTTLSISFVISSNFMDTLITNNAEITAAFNALGLTDEDGDLLNVNGNSGDISELGSDNDYSDDDENAPGDEDNELDVDDYDPAQIVINQEFDLALVKNLAESGPIFSGDTVTFNITVYNQGTMDATGVVITDYVPTGMTNVDPDWIGNTFSIGNLASGDSITVAIDLKVSENFMEASMTNNAEITSASNTLSLEDEDGAITTINGTVDDMSEITTDDDVDDESPGTTRHLGQSCRCGRLRSCYGFC